MAVLPVAELRLIVGTFAAFGRLLVAIHLDLQLPEVLTVVQVLVWFTHSPAPPLSKDLSYAEGDAGSISAPVEG